MKTIQWGVIGLGKIAHKFVSDLQTVANCKVHAVLSTSLDRAQDFANQYGASHFTDSLEDFLATEGLDVVYVAVEHVRHHHFVMACLNANIPVLGEKPFGMNLNEVSEMVELAQSKKTFLMEALWSRFMPTILTAKSWIDEGKIGTIKQVQADFGFKGEYDPTKRLFNKNLGGGALLDIGIYPIFLGYLTLGFPDTITAQATFSPTGVDTNTVITFGYTNNATASLSCTFDATTRCEGNIYGDEGSIKIHSRWHESTAVSLCKNEQEEVLETFDRNGTMGYEYEIAHVNECLRNGLTESPTWTLNNSLDLMKLLDLIREQIGLIY